MLMQFLAVSGWLFWGLLMGAVVLDIILLSNDAQPPAVFVTVLLVSGVLLFTDAFVGFRWVTLVLFAAAYFVIGIIWSFKKWIELIGIKKIELQKLYDRITAPKETFVSYMKDKQPTAADNKASLVGWMTLWPFSVTWWVLTWPRKVFVWAYERLSTLYDRISAHIWERA